MDFTKKIEERINQVLESKRNFNVLYVTDENSRLSCVRGYSAMQEFKKFYANIADVTLTAMDSKTFCAVMPNLNTYNVVWVDNVISAKFNDCVTRLMKESFSQAEPDWKIEAEAQARAVRTANESGDAAAIEAATKAYDEFMSSANEYRSLITRVIYAVDEFYWDAPGGRNRTIIDGRVIQDALNFSDTVVVPNNELRTAIVQLGLVAEDKDVVVIPSFVSSQFYPTHKVFLKSKGGCSTIRRPRILVKGTVIPQNLQNFIMHSTDDYDFTISSIGELSPRLLELLRPRGKKDTPEVRHIMHWGNPYVTNRNLAETMAMERDANFDFVILAEPEDVANDIYSISDTDTDAILAIASGAVVFAQIAEAEFGKGIHICNECGEGFTFGSKTSVKDIREMIEKRRITVKWDQAYTIQRTLLEHRLVSDANVLSGFFSAMLGKRLSTTLKARFDEGMSKLKKDNAATKSANQVEDVVAKDEEDAEV